MSEPFVAEVRIFAGNFNPRGWAFCDGQTLPIAQNTALFSLIGTTYGGDGRTTTGLPDLRGRAAMHPGRGPGLTSRRLGERLGAGSVTLTEGQMPSHSHTAVASSDPAFRRGTTSPVGAVPGTPERPHLAYASAAGSTTTMAATGPTGGGQAHDNMQPYLAMSFIIALVGQYPSRS